MKIVSVRTALSFIILIFSLLMNANFAQQNGKLRVTVIGTNDWIIRGVPIAIEGENVRRSFTSGEELNYDFDLPPGIYRITTLGDYWHSFQRAQFRVTSGGATSINVLPTMRILEAGTSVSSEGAKSLTKFAGAPNYEVLWPEGGYSSIVIRYDSMHEEGSEVVYAGIRRWQGDTNVMASYDTVTIYADRIRVDRKTFQLDVEGDVIIEDGKERLRKSRVRVIIKNGVPVFIG